MAAATHDTVEIVWVSGMARIGQRAWLVWSLMVAACGYPSLPAICGGELCRPEQECAAAQDICIDIHGCGNGVIDPGEVCDDGNAMDGDGCSADCTSNETCGNGLADTNAQIPEQCDEGRRNGMVDSNCDLNCHFVCGNGVVNQDHGEMCDPGPMDSANCNSNLANMKGLALGCKFSMCGDGYTNMAAGEQCDAGDTDTSVCNGSSAHNINGESLGCHLSMCGDGYVNTAGNEECDKGVVDTSICNGPAAGLVSCHLAKCGDGYMNIKAGEQCDPPGSQCSGGKTCTASCTCS